MSAANGLSLEEVPRLGAILETSHYVSALDVSAAFSARVCGLEVFSRDDRMCAMGVAVWEKYLQAQCMPMESRITGPVGGTSLHVRDPVQHSVEVAAPRLWQSW